MRSYSPAPVNQTSCTSRSSGSRKIPSTTLLMEAAPCEAVKNNVLATAALARQAHAATEEKVRKDAERAARVEAAAALKKDQKAARDSKYAARKARQG